MVALMPGPALLLQGGDSQMTLFLTLTIFYASWRQGRPITQDDAFE